MNFYRHYKDKPYRIYGIAKHSETLEELVVYETLYENPTARLWVRPRAMFEENVTIGSKTKPRFERVPLEIRALTEISPADEEILMKLGSTLFPKWNPQEFSAKLRKYLKPFLQLAMIDQRVIGFKLGHEMERSCFYSWFGGVLPEFRRLGIAELMLKAQHEWCKLNGYEKIRTKTKNEYRAMLQLNIKSGFNIVGVDSDEKIVLEKNLTR